MKKIYLIAVLAGTSVIAQPIIHQSDVVFNVESEVFIAEADAFDPGIPGANTTWDFSDLTLMPVGSSRTTSPTGTPSVGLFPTSNFCSASVASTPASYVYFRHNAQKMELLGESYIGIGVINYNSNPKTYLEFPYTYNKVINDTYKAALDDEVAFTTTYDAYGTLVLPFGTYNNVVRQKIVENGQTDYVWFNVSPFFPIVHTALADGAVGVMKSTLLSTDAFLEKQAFTLFPNPTSGSFKIDIKNFEGAEINVYNVLGKMVASQKTSEPLTQIDINDCSAGIYFVKVATKDLQASVQKIVKK